MVKRRFSIAGVLFVTGFAVWLFWPKAPIPARTLIHERAAAQSWWVTSMRGDIPTEQEPFVICSVGTTREQLASLPVGKESPRWIGRVFVTCASAIAPADWGPNARQFGDCWLYGDLTMIELLTRE